MTLRCLLGFHDWTEWEVEERSNAWPIKWRRRRCRLCYIEQVKEVRR